MYVLDGDDGGVAPDESVREKAPDRLPEGAREKASDPCSNLASCASTTLMTLLMLCPSIICSHSLPQDAEWSLSSGIWCYRKSMRFSTLRQVLPGRPILLGITMVVRE